MKIHDGMPRWTPALDDRLCELVSDLDAQYTFGDIARIMGLSKNAVTSRWRRIVARMGEGA